MEEEIWKRLQRKGMGVGRPELCVRDEGERPEESL